MADPENPIQTSFQPLRNQTYQVSFDWPIETKATASVNEKQLTFSFDKPGTVNFDVFSRQLGNNFTLVSISKGGKDLKLRVRTRTYYRISQTEVIKKKWIFTLVPDEEKNKRAAQLREKNEFLRLKQEGLNKSDGSNLTLLKDKDLPEIANVTIKHVTDGERKTLTFEWDRPTQLAVFSDQDGLWMYFSHPAKYKIPTTLKPVLTQGKKEGYSWLHWKAMPKLHPNISRGERHQWILDFSSKTPLIADQAVLGFTQDKNDNTYGIIPLRGSSSLIDVHNPKTDVHLTIIPVTKPAHAVPREEKFLQFDLLPTHQGVVVRHKTDQLYVSILPEQIKLSALPNLLISRNPKEDDALDRNFSSLLQLYDWSTEKKPWVVIHEKLRFASTNNQGVSRIKAVTDLSRFYLESGMTTEAVALLERLNQKNPSLIKDPQFMALYAVTNLIERNYQEARTYLYHSLLNEDPEIQVWQGIYSTLQGDWHAALSKFHYALSYALTYPPQLRNAVLLYVSEAYIMAGNIPETERHLNRLKKPSLSPTQKHYFKYISGQLEKAKGKEDEAEAIWQQAFENADPFTKTKIGLALIKLHLKKETASLKAAIHTFENLKFFWRDGYIELEILKSLGLLYYKVGAYPESFYSFELFLKHARTPEQQQEGQETLIYHLEDLLLDKMTPQTLIKGLSLFEKHKSTLKKSSKIQSILEKLIQAYLDLNLVDRALVLMEEIRDYLKPDEIFENTLQQATLLTINDQASKAINILLPLTTKNTEQQTLKEHSLARAYLKSGETTKALNILKNDKTEEGLLIRTLVYRAEKNWFLAAEGFKKMFETEKEENVRADLLSQAVIAYTLAEKKEALKDLYLQNSMLMKASQHADFFKLMEQSNFDPRLNQSSFAVMFNTFMQKYDENMKRLISL